MEKWNTQILCFVLRLLYKGQSCKISPLVGLCPTNQKKNISEPSLIVNYPPLSWSLHAHLFVDITYV